jgi:hypothetical protein
LYKRESRVIVMPPKEEQIFEQVNPEIEGRWKGLQYVEICVA